MLDPKLLRQDIQAVKQQLQRKHFHLDDAAITNLEEQRKALQVETQDLQNKRNVVSKQIGQAKAKGESTEDLFKQVAGIGETLKEKEAALQALQESLSDQLSVIPNLLHPDVPAGKDENDNQLIRKWGEPRQFDFEVQDHVSLGEALGGMDFATASKLSGSRFVVLQGKLARLHRALAQFMLDVHVNSHGYLECYVPYLVNSESLYGTGQLSKFQDGDQFGLKDDDLWLIPTSEVPLTNIARDVIYEEADLPVKLTAHTPCFRREAGSYGKDTRGLIRQHQFEKVEMVQLVHPDKSYEALESLTQNAETILQKLNLPYQCVRLCGGDTGFSAAMTYDLEVWLPGQNAYREISSCSNMEAFQARRIQARYRDKASGKPQLLHTLNGSGLAVGRTLVAVMENYQQADGTIAIPDCLQCYMAGDLVL